MEEVRFKVLVSFFQSRSNTEWCVWKYFQSSDWNCAENKIIEEFRISEWRFASSLNEPVVIGLMPQGCPWALCGTGAGICLPVQGIQVWSLIWEDVTCLRATEQMHLEPCGPQLENPGHNNGGWSVKEGSKSLRVLPTSPCKTKNSLTGKKNGRSGWLHPA